VGRPGFRSKAKLGFQVKNVLLNDWSVGGLLGLEKIQGGEAADRSTPD